MRHGFISNIHKAKGNECSSSKRHDSVLRTKNKRFRVGGKEKEAFLSI